MDGLKTILNLVAEIGSLDDINAIRSLILDEIRKIIWFDTANFWLYPPVHGWEQHVVIDTPVKSLNSYLHHYANSDEFHLTYNNSNITIARSTELLDYSRWTRHSAYYYDFLHSNHIYYLLAFDIKDNSRTYGAICLHRERCNRDFSEQDRNQLATLYPHLVNRFKWEYEKQVLMTQLSNEAFPASNILSDRFSFLTERERSVVQQVTSGASNLEVSKSLGISVNTVKMHLQNIFTKLDIHRRNQLYHL